MLQFEHNLVNSLLLWLLNSIFENNNYDESKENLPISERIQKRKLIYKSGSPE